MDTQSLSSYKELTWVDEMLYMLQLLCFTLGGTCFTNAGVALIARINGVLIYPAISQNIFYVIFVLGCLFIGASIALWNHNRKKGSHYERYLEGHFTSSKDHGLLSR